MNLQRQTGMTMIGWLIVFALIGFFTLIILKLFPVYYEGLAAKSIIAELEEDLSLRGLTNKEIHKAITSRFNVNDLNINTKKAIKVKTKPGGVRLITLDYEVRKNFAGNVDLVCSFAEEVELPASK